MPHAYLDIAQTPRVKALQEQLGSRAQHARYEDDGPVIADRLGGAEEAFIAERDGFYMATVSETSWPYVQFRGGPEGFLRVLDEKTLGFADFRGNRQYISAGNLAGNDRVALFLMDYAAKRRLKIFGQVELCAAASDPALIERLRMPGYEARIDRGALIHIAGFNWNCPQHITPRYTEAEITAALAPLNRRVAALEKENERLRGLLASAGARG